VDTAAVGAANQRAQSHIRLNACVVTTRFDLEFTRTGHQPHRRALAAHNNHDAQLISGARSTIRVTTAHQSLAGQLARSF
jgi:hypothetical protein